MKKLAIFLSIDLIYAGIIIFLVVQPVKQPAKHDDGVIRGYVYAEWSSTGKKIDQVFLPGVLVTVKDENGATADMVKSKPDGSYNTKHLKFGSYTIYLSKNGFPVSWYNAFVGNTSNLSNSLKSNLNTENYAGETAKIRTGSADY
jgi:hypothetical protein